MVFYGLTTREEDDDFLFRVSSKEGEEEEETFICFTDDITLFQGLHCRVLHVCVDIDVERFRAEGNSR